MRRLGCGLVEGLSNMSETVGSILRSPPLLEKLFVGDREMGRWLKGAFCLERTQVCFPALNPGPQSTVPLKSVPSPSSAFINGCHVGRNETAREGL